MNEIIEILERDARTTPEEIATMLGRNVDEVVKTIKELEKTGVIVRYKTVINEERIRNDRVMALIEVKVTPERELGFDAIAERIYRFPEVRNCYLMSGGYDLMVLVEGNSLQEVAGFVSQKLSTLDHVTGTATHFVLKTYKENGDLFITQNESQHPLAVAP